MREPFAEALSVLGEGCALVAAQSGVATLPCRSYRRAVRHLHEQQGRGQ